MSYIYITELYYIVFMITDALTFKQNFNVAAGWCEANFNYCISN